MKTITNIKMLFVLLLSSLLCSSLQAGQLKKNKQDATTETESTAVVEKKEKDNNRFPIGCTPVGFQQHLKVLSLYPGKEGALQSMYFFFNQLPQTVSLYQMRGKESEHSIRFNHSIKPNSWAVLAIGERDIKFICTLGDGKGTYGQIVDCANTIKVCEYVHVKFGLNNKGNFWIVDSNYSRNGAVNDVVHYGIIPGV